MLRAVPPTAPCATAICMELRGRPVEPGQEKATTCWRPHRGLLGGTRGSGNRRQLPTSWGPREFSDSREEGTQRRGRGEVSLHLRKVCSASTVNGFVGKESCHRVTGITKGEVGVLVIQNRRTQSLKRNES